MSNAITPVEEQMYTRIEHACGLLAEASAIARRLLPPPNGMVPVRQQDANRYCEILRMFGMEETGDPVEAIRDLIDNRPPAASDFDRLSVAYPFAVSHEAPPAVLDLVLWQNTPTLTVPRHAPFEPLPASTSGHRYLVASDGLWLECRRPWLHLIWPIGTTAPENLVSTHATPFGTLTRKVEIAFGKIPHHLIRSFAARGMISCPKERGAWMSWEYGLEGTEPRLVWSESVDSEGTPGGLQYARPEHTATLSPCIDFHTHGTAPAFFSATDDADDAHDVKIAIVLGNLDQPIPTIAARLCCLGVFIPVNVSAEQVFGAST